MVDGSSVKQLIQVFWDISDPASRSREIAGLLEASTLGGCDSLIIITSDYEEEINVGAKNDTCCSCVENDVDSIMTTTFVSR